MLATLGTTYTAHVRSAIIVDFLRNTMVCL